MVYIIIVLSKLLMRTGFVYYADQLCFLTGPTLFVLNKSIKFCLKLHSRDFMDFLTTTLTASYKQSELLRNSSP